MITVHHLNDSRSHRILWLLEELSVPYEVKFYLRDPKSQHAPAALRCVNPLGKAPAVTENGDTLIESGAIIETLIRRHGACRLQPPIGHAAYDKYIQWLHYAEGAAMPALTLSRQITRLAEPGAPARLRASAQIALHLGYIERSLEGRPFLLGDELTGADIQMSFVGEVAAAREDIRPYPMLDAWVSRFQALSSYRAALARGGPYAFARP